jgi:uncharacterized membrane protein
MLPVGRPTGSKAVHSRNKCNKLCLLQTIMNNAQSQFLLLILLLLYLIGRILQLFVGSVPSLLIVAFHVIPPALFAVIHGARIYRACGILVFVTLCLGVGALFESVSLRTGFPFGHYTFTDLLGPKLFDLPILLALAYVGMGYLSWVLGLVILECQNEALTGKTLVLAPLAASLVMTAWDLSMDPVWADIDHAWVWRDGGPYYGVPISNFFGWFLTAYIFYQLFALYLRKQSVYVVADKSLATRYFVLCGIRSRESPGYSPRVFRRSLCGCCGQTLDDPRHTFGL